MIALEYCVAPHYIAVMAIYTNEEMEWLNV
jgi:hypothetical protein